MVRTGIENASHWQNRRLTLVVCEIEVNFSFVFVIMANRALQSHLEIWHNLIWALFLVWTGVGFIVMPFGIGEPEIAKLAGEMNLPEALTRALLLILQASDAVWILLAAFTVYLSLARVEGFNRARVIGVIIIVGSAILEVIGETTDFPFGPYDYTNRFGSKVFGVLPFTIPLAWLVVVVAGRHLMLAIAPTLNRWQHALGVGTVALLTDLNLEFIAWQVRYYWVWYPVPYATPAHGWPPVQNYISWFVFAALLAYVIPRAEPKKTVPVSQRIIGVLLAMNALFLFTHIVRFFL